MTVQPHIIRLRDPWQWVACDVPAADDVAHIRVSRSFNRPTGLEPGTQVVLVIKGIPALRTVRLNDQTLSRRAERARTDDAWTCEIGNRLDWRNRLQLRIDSPNPANVNNSLRTSLAAGNVRLEIYDAK